MDFGAVVAQVNTFAQDAVFAFVIAVVVDDILGVSLSVKARTFDIHRLPSFLMTQFGTRQAFVLAGAIAAVAITGNENLSQVHQSALVIVTAGGGALTLSVVKDIYLKIRALAS